MPRTLAAALWGLRTRGNSQCPTGSCFQSQAFGDVRICPHWRVYNPVQRGGICIQLTHGPAQCPGQRNGSILREAPTPGLPRRSSVLSDHVLWECPL